MNRVTRPPPRSRSRPRQPTLSGRFRGRGGGRERGGLAHPLSPPLDPQHPQQGGKYEMKLRSHPQQIRNKSATEAQRTEVEASKR